MVRTTVAVVLLGGLAGFGGASSAAEGDPAAGERVFVRCKACHVADQEQNRIGPHLVGLFGREAGSVEGYNYSDAMKNADVVWGEDTLDQYLADPRGYIPGNKMAFAGLRDEQDRADLIAHLKEVTATN